MTRYDLFTEEHEAFRASVKDFIQKELAPHTNTQERRIEI